MPGSDKTPDAGAEMLLAGWALLAMLTGYVMIPLLAMLCGGNAWTDTARAATGMLGGIIGIVIMLLAAQRMNGSWHAAFSLLKIDTFQWYSVLRALWLAPALLLTGGMLTLLWCWAGGKAGLEFSLPPATLALSSGSLASRLTLAVSAILLAPIFEELVFRRAIYGALTTRMTPAWAAGLTALGFAAVHLSLLQLPGIWWLGWNWQRVLQKDNSLWSSILLHAINNLMSVGAVLLWGGVELGENFGM